MHVEIFENKLMHINPKLNLKPYDYLIYMDNRRITILKEHYHSAFAQNGL